jgi:hypothetical protein
MITIDDSRTTLLNPTVWMPSDDYDYFWRGTALLLFIRRGQGYHQEVSERNCGTSSRWGLLQKSWFLTSAVLYWYVPAPRIDSDVRSLTILSQALAHPRNIRSFYHVSTQFLNYNPLRCFWQSWFPLWRSHRPFSTLIPFLRTAVLVRTHTSTSSLLPKPVIF